jgi:cellulose synthase/poly-beta-1,6-N-acetylglucosamine synthase-like glycosyltransferase
MARGYKGIKMTLSIALILVMIGFLFTTGYLYLLTLASLLPMKQRKPHRDHTYFSVVIPAHNEESVIADTVRLILKSCYPKEYFDVFVVADHCTDNTAMQARNAGAIVFERNNAATGGKGAALSWLFKEILKLDKGYHAFVIFDADTHVDRIFFQKMHRMMACGAQAVQGRHVILNHDQGWLPALTWAMFIIDNRFQNLGRSRLGWSAKNMGDSICITAELIQRYGWGEGLTEDYAFRHMLLLDGVCIDYEPEAIGYGNAAENWRIARAQRGRWLRGTYQASRHSAFRLMREGFRKRNLAMLDGAVQAILPSYSSLTLLTVSFLILCFFLQTYIYLWILYVFIFLATALFLFPFVNLTLEKAPRKAFLIILTGPFYIVWRTLNSLYSRFIEQNDQWVRTPRTTRDELKTK